MRLSRSSQQRASRGLCAARRSGKAARSARARAARRISTSPPCTCRRNTEATSRSTSSGALSRSPRRRARARSPSGPSSPRAVARTLASTTITIGAQRRYRRLQRNRTSRAAARPVKDLLKGRFAGLLDEPGPQVLLEGLVRGSCALTQDGMSLLGHIFDLHARHGAIMALEAPVRKRCHRHEATFRPRRAAARTWPESSCNRDWRELPEVPGAVMLITCTGIAGPPCATGPDRDVTARSEKCPEVAG